MFSRLRRFIAPLLASAALLTGTAVVFAQKPALTKSVDEPGRSPYFSQANGSCDFTSCTLNFKVVPAGFRLVVTHAAATFTKSGGGSTLVILQQMPLTYQELMPAAASAGANDYVVSTPEFFFVEAGAAPQIEVFRSVANGSVAFGSLSGYLVALN